MEDVVQKFSEGGDPQGHHGHIELVFRKKISFEEQDSMVREILRYL